VTKEYSFLIMQFVGSNTVS